MVYGGIYLYTQHKLNQADKEIQDWLDDFGDLDSMETLDNKDNNDKVGEYNVGDAVTLLDDSKWHIVSVSGDTIVLLSDTLAKQSSGYRKTAELEDQKYQNSSIKEYFENEYLPNLKNNLTNKNGNIGNLSVILLKLDEFVSLTNARWVSDLKLGSYSIYKSDAGDNFAWLSMTPSYWLQDYIIDTENNGFFYGTYFVEVDIDDSSEYWSTMQIETDQCGDSSSSQQCADFYGIRPVIETTIKNLK